VAPVAGNLGGKKNTGIVPIALHALAAKFIIARTAIMKS